MSQLESEKTTEPVVTVTAPSARKPLPKAPLITAATALVLLSTAQAQWGFLKETLTPTQFSLLSLAAAIVGAWLHIRADQEKRCETREEDAPKA